MCVTKTDVKKEAQNTTTKVTGVKLPKQGGGWLQGKIAKTHFNLALWFAGTLALASDDFRLFEK